MKESDFVIMYGAFLQPSEAMCAALGMGGADKLGIHVFSGSMEKDHGHWRGVLSDKHGVSDLTEIAFEPESTLVFTKRYRTRGRTDHIVYTCTWNAEKQWWNGEWSMYRGKKTLDTGSVNLFLISSSLDFFFMKKETEVL